MLSSSLYICRCPLPSSLFELLLITLYSSDFHLFRFHLYSTYNLSYSLFITLHPFHIPFFSFSFPVDASILFLFLNNLFPFLPSISSTPPYFFITPCHVPASLINFHLTCSFYSFPIFPHQWYLIISVISRSITFKLKTIQISRPTF